MKNRSILNRSLLIPIGIGCFSALGVCLIALIVFLDTPPSTAPVEDTSTPFKYLFLGTETPVPTSETDTPSPIEISARKPGVSTTPEDESPSFSTPGTSQANLTVINSTESPTITPTVGTSVLLVVERYDDTDDRLIYDGDWTGETDVQNAYQGTLVISTTTASDITFTFEGQQIVIGYFGGAGLGSLFISIDDNEYLLNQSAGTTWFSPQFAQGEHFVILVHQSGTSVNLDYIDILGSS